MADDLQITPQGDEPANGDSSVSPGGYKFDPSQDAETSNGNINLAGGETPAPIPGLIGASSEKEGEIIAPMKLETEAPAAEEAAAEVDATEPDIVEEAATDKPVEEKSSVMETSPETESTEDVSTEDVSEEAPTEELPTDAETPAEPAPKKKGLPKAALVGGALMLAMVIGAGAYYGLGGLFKGALEPIDTLSPAAGLITNVCPVDTYYDTGLISSDMLRSIDSTATDAITPITPRSSTSLDRQVAARDYGKAQILNLRAPVVVDNVIKPAAVELENTQIDTITVTSTQDYLEAPTDVVLGTGTAPITTNDETVITAPSENTVSASDAANSINLTDENFSTVIVPDYSISDAMYDLEVVDTPSEEEQPSISVESTTMPSGNESYESDTTYTSPDYSDALAPGIMQDNDTSYTYEDGTESLVIDSSLMEGLDGQDGIIVKPDTETTSSFDPSMCKPIPRDDCQFLETLRADPTKFFLAELTLTHLDEWLLACKAVTSCGTNEMLIDGKCACEKGAFDISSALTQETSDTRLIDTITTEPDLTCVTCDQLTELIKRRVEALASPLKDTDTVALEKEITLLKDLAAVNCVQEEPVVVKDCPVNQVRDVSGVCVCDTGYELNADGICLLSTKPVVTTCGLNQTLQRDGTCSCDDGYFDISSASASTTTTTTDYSSVSETVMSDVLTRDISTTKDTITYQILDTADTSNLSTAPVCVDCAQLEVIIAKKKSQLTTETDKTALEAEITTLEKLAIENGCTVTTEEFESLVPTCTGVNEITNDIGECVCIDTYVRNTEGICEMPTIMTVVEQTACDQFAENAEALLVRGDVRGSYDAAIEYIKNDCGRTYTDCEEYLAIAKTAKEYSSIAATLSPASVSYFDDQYTRNRNAFYANPECVNTTELCVEVQSEPVINDRLVDTVDEPSVKLLATDRIDTSPDVLRVDAMADEPLTLEKLQRDVEYYISVKGIEDDKEKADYIDRYCEEEVVTVREEPAPVRDTVVEEVPAPVRLVPITVPEEAVTSPPSPAASDNEPMVVIAAAEEQPIAGGSVSKPIAGGTVSPAVTSPPTETAAVASDTFVSSTTTTTTTSSTETVSPATTTPALHSAATVASPSAPAEPTLTPVDPTQPAPLITQETAPPDIHPVGPEVYMYAFALIASQLYFFRRRILEFVMNK